MGYWGTLIFIMAIASFALTGVGLANTRPHVSIVIANIAVISFGLFGAYHALIEGPSPLWVSIYLTLVAVGFSSCIRQFTLWRRIKS